jgi:hypothetical protein
MISIWKEKSDKFLRLIENDGETNLAVVNSSGGTLFYIAEITEDGLALAGHLADFDTPFKTDSSGYIRVTKQD